MKKLAALLLVILLTGFFASVAFAAEQAAKSETPKAEEETEYSYGTVSSIAGDQLVVSEYDFEKDADVNVNYAVDATTKFENVTALTEIAAGDSVEIDYLVKDGKNVAKLVSVEKMTQPKTAAPATGSAAAVASATATTEAPVAATSAAPATTEQAPAPAPAHS